MLLIQTLLSVTVYSVYVTEQPHVEVLNLLPELDHKSGSFLYKYM